MWVSVGVCCLVGRMGRGRIKAFGKVRQHVIEDVHEGDPKSSTKESSLNFG